MTHSRKTFAALAAMLSAVLFAMTTDGGGETQSQDHRARRGEQDGDGREHARDDGQRGEEGEESGTMLDLDEKYDDVRNGVRLMLTYDRKSYSFTGTVENITGETLSKVRVEVHLSSERELGPTKSVDLEPGETKEVRLTATSHGFERWTAHPEVGAGEHDRHER